MDRNKSSNLINVLILIIILIIIILMMPTLKMKFVRFTEKNNVKNKVYRYIESVESSVVSNYEVDCDGQYVIKKDKLIKEDIELKVSYKENEISGILLLEKGKVVLAELSIEKYELIYLNGKVYISGENVRKIETYTDGTTVYFNPETGRKCNESEAVSVSGTKGGCMKWYTFGDSENKVFLKLLLDHNMSTSAWISKEDYIASGGTEEEYGANGNTKYGPVTVTKKLKDDASTWKHGLNPRLITANEVANITGNDIMNNWNSHANTDLFYLGTNNTTLDKTLNNNYAWLFDRLNDCEGYGCNIQGQSDIVAYWTSDVLNGDSTQVWNITGYGNLNYVYSNYTLGIRPVITVSKLTIS